MTEKRFDFSFTPFTKKLFSLLGIGSRRASVLVTDTSIEITMGWAFQVSIPRTAVQSAISARKPFGYGYGVHGKPGVWVVNGSDNGIVRLTIVPPVRGRMMVFSIRPRELYLSLEDPNGFLDAIAR